MQSSFIANEKPDSFITHTASKIEDAGTLRNIIKYPGGLILSYKKQNLGILALPSTETGGNPVVNMTFDSGFKVTDVNGFVKFSGDLLKESKVTFSISTNNLVVESLDLKQTVTNLSMSKDITVDGFNGLQDVTIGNLDIANHSAIIIKAQMKNPSNIGIDMGTVNFTLTAITSHLTEETGLIGPLVANSLIMHPKSTNEITFVLSPTNFPNLFQLISCGGKILIKGVSVKPSTGADVLWLSIPIQNYRVIKPFSPLLPHSVNALLQAFPAEMIESSHVCSNETSKPTGTAPNEPKKTDAPKAKESSAPKAKESTAPKAKESNAPKAKESDAPKVKKTEAPKESKEPKES
ncbi:2356_t:CDS:1 [Racocetra persica]|uniref:2356_t:CDS:1 n=1 Tax=Racocetra persica TaxID=160502 RepID=A0ACA9Q7V8_9GLOM|nr:2356_t:CDS:1 [Racocetra persica]